VIEVVQKDRLELLRLTQLLQKTPVLSREKARQLNSQYTRDRISRMLASGETFGQASGTMQHLNQTNEDFRAFMKRIDNELVVQLRIVQEAVALWFAHGEYPPPHYAWRVTVILRKAGMSAEEAAFISSYARHFCQPPIRGSTERKIWLRAQKLGFVSSI
jgi:hypothetical protein